MPCTLVLASVPAITVVLVDMSYATDVWLITALVPVIVVPVRPTTS